MSCSIYTLNEEINACVFEFPTIITIKYFLFLNSWKVWGLGHRSEWLKHPNIVFYGNGRESHKRGRVLEPRTK